MAGRSQLPSQHKDNLKDCLMDTEDGESFSDHSTYLPNVCTEEVFIPVLSHYKQTFQGLVQQGSELKKRKGKSPYPKRDDIASYKELNKQNEWLRQNVFDAMDNYLFCAACLKNAFQISYQRLSRQRKIKQQESQQPLIAMTKSQVQNERVSDYLVMPADCDQSFRSWWIKLDANVQIRYPHERHSNAEKIS